MSHYKTNLRDIEFNLFEFNLADDRYGSSPFGEIDGETARDILREIDRLAKEEFAASFVEADRVELKVQDGEVKLPESVKASLDAYYDGGWDRLGLPEHLGGSGAAPSLRWAVQELLVGANPAVYFYVVGTLMASVIDEVGTPEQVERFALPLIERRWGGTMVLTEADAGSDVGAGTTRAFDNGDGTWNIEGVKRFITSGESDYFENIIHLVLARPEGSGPGTKGLSMFIVPKFMVEDDGSLGERNGVMCTAVEHKMGIKGSSTCELTFGMDRPAIGYLVGDSHDGIRQMFRVIENARMLIGTKSLAGLSTGYLNALEFAKERHQGADLTEGRNPSAPRVPIIRHPNVRRLLMDQKAHVEGMRAMLYFGAWVQDMVVADPAEPRWSKLDDLLLPLIKGYGSEKAYELLGQALQVFGGSGFTQDYPLEQYIRDVKIDSLYEGTTAIQALDLFFRKIARDRGETLAWLASMITETIKGAPGNHDPMAAERLALGEAMDEVQAQVGLMVEDLMRSSEEPTQIYDAALHANSLLEGMAELVIGWLLIRHAEVAATKLPDAKAADEAFYSGKIESARWFATTVLPKAKRRRQLTEAETGHIMEIPVEAF